MQNTSFFSISDSPLQSPTSKEEKNNNNNNTNDNSSPSSTSTPKAKFVDLPDQLRNSDSDSEHQDQSLSTSKKGTRSDENQQEHPLSEEQYAAAQALKEKLEREREEKNAAQKEKNMFLEDDDDEEDIEEFVKRQKEKKEQKKKQQQQQQASGMLSSSKGYGSSYYGSSEAASSALSDDGNNSESNSSSSISAFLSTIDYSSHARYGFPCRLEPAIAVREEARCRLLLQQHLAAADTAWKQALRGCNLLYQADSATCEQLKKISRKYGIPTHLRSVVWMTMTKIACKVEEHQPQGYGAMLEQAMPADVVIPKLTLQSIEQDLDRTFPEHPYFRKNAEGHRKLRWVLHNLYRRSPINGYCQSYNFLTATFLLVLGGDLESTLWLMLLTFETLIPNDYYNQQLDGVKIDQRVLTDLIRQHLPKVSQHFDRIGFEAGMLIPVWLMSGFTNCLPMETAIAVWDWIFGGDTTQQTPGLLIVAIALLKNSTDEILMCDDPNDTAMLLSQLSDITFDWPKLIKTANDLALLISAEAVQSLRRKHRVLIQQEEMKKEAKRVEKEAMKKRLENLKVYGSSNSPTSPSPPSSLKSPVMDLEDYLQNETIFIMSSPKTTTITANNRNGTTSNNSLSPAASSSATGGGNGNNNKVDPNFVNRTAQANSTFGETVSPQQAVHYDPIEMIKVKQKQQQQQQNQKPDEGNNVMHKRSVSNSSAK